MPREKPDQERFERIAAAYLVESEVEGLASIRYDIVSLLVTGSEKALLRATTRTSSTTEGDPKVTAPGLRTRGGASLLGSACQLRQYLNALGTL